MAQDREPVRVQFSAENAELKSLRIRPECMELMVRALETLAESRELLIKADELWQEAGHILAPMVPVERIERFARLAVGGVC